MITSSNQDCKGGNQTEASSWLNRFDDSTKDWKKFKEQIQNLGNKQSLAVFGIMLAGCVLSGGCCWLFGLESVSDVLYWMFSTIGIGTSALLFCDIWLTLNLKKYGLTRKFWARWVKEIDQLEPMEEKEALELLERCCEEGLTDTPEFQCCWNLREQLGYWPVLFRKMTSVLGAEASVSFKLKALEGLIEPTASQPSPERENRLKLPLELARQAQSTSKP